MDGAMTNTDAISTEKGAPAAPAPKADLKSMDLPSLEAFVRSLGEPAYRGRQLFKWLYQKGAGSFDEMTDLPRRFREALAERAVLSRIENVRLLEASDGTVKGLFRLSSGRHVEAVLIPDFDEEGDPNRLTVCVSSQVGCALGCTFCATGQFGFTRHLSVGEVGDVVLRDRRALAHCTVLALPGPSLPENRRSGERVATPDRALLSSRRLSPGPMPSVRGSVLPPLHRRHPQSPRPD